MNVLSIRLEKEVEMCPLSCYNLIMSRSHIYLDIQPEDKGEAGKVGVGGCCSSPADMIIILSYYTLYQSIYQK